jgi:uncharacterized protein (TIGR03643 family)
MKTGGGGTKSSKKGSTGKNSKRERFSTGEIDRIIELAWEDRSSFEVIDSQFGLKNADVIKLMREEMTSSSFKMWRARTQGRKTKHEALRSPDVKRFKSKNQKVSGRTAKKK